MFDWIFFDLDGTLWDHTAASDRALEMLCREHDLELEQLGPKFHEVNEVVWRDLAEGRMDFKTLRVQRFREILRFFGEDRDPGLAEHWSTFFVEQYLTFQGELPGASEAVEAAAKIAKVAVLTNAPHETQDTKLGQLRARDRFEFILTPDETGCLKPDKRFFEHAERHADVRDPARVLCIGDSWKADIAPPLERGWKTIWIRPDGTPLPLERSGDPLATAATITDVRLFLDSLAR